MTPEAKKAKTEPTGMPIITTAAEMRAWSREQRKQGKRVAFVPTMVSEGVLSLLLCRESLGKTWRSVHVDMQCVINNFSALPVSVSCLGEQLVGILDTRGISTMATCRSSRQPGAWLTWWWPPFMSTQPSLRRMRTLTSTPGSQ